ncbi:MAG TPA: hypothetical protein VL133_05010, partial [Devosia sp.]|nr:hypothetical protein [Devosia sp.]
MAKNALNGCRFSNIEGAVNMTTGKPHQMAEPSNSSDDLIAELSKLMAQEAHGNRQDAIKPAEPVPHQDFSTPPAATPAEPHAAPFAVRIPGAAAPASQPLATAPPAPRF